MVIQRQNLSHAHYLALRRAAGYSEEEDISEQMWNDTPEPLKECDTEKLEEEAYFHQELFAKRTVFDKPDSEVTPW